MEEINSKYNPSYIPQIGFPEKNNFKERTYIRAIYHKATAPGFFGVIVLCFFMSFINIKCNGRLMNSYSGIEIIRGVDKNNIGKKLIVINVSARHTYEKAKKMAEWKKNMKEDYEEYVDDAPYFEPNSSEVNNFENPGDYSFENITKNSQQTRLFIGLTR